jgi:hypothetical protein
MLDVCGDNEVAQPLAAARKQCESDARTTRGDV